MTHETSYIRCQKCPNYQNKLLIFEFSRLFSNLVFDILSLAFLTDFFPNLVLSTFPKGKGKQQVIENLQNSENGLIISFFLICLRKLRRDPEKQVYSVWCIAKALKKKRLDYEVFIIIHSSCY